MILGRKSGTLVSRIQVLWEAKMTQLRFQYLQLNLSRVVVWLRINTVVGLELYNKLAVIIKEITIIMTYIDNFDFININIIRYINFIKII